MNRTTATRPAELADVRAESPPRFRMLAAVVGAPLAWTLHLMASYVMVAAWCAAEWGGLRMALAITTLVCAALAAGSGLAAVALWRDGQAMLRRDAEPGDPEGWSSRMGERGARISFLAAMSIGAALLFAFLILLQGLPPLFTPACWAGVSA